MKISKKKKEHMKPVSIRKGLDPIKRQDKSLQHVIINEKRNRRATKYMVNDVPYPFETREQYEQSIRVPIGKEWNTAHMFGKMTLPRIKKTDGAVIQPIKFVKQPAGKRRNPIKK